jgi:hypothetical protein
MRVNKKESKLERCGRARKKRERAFKLRESKKDESEQEMRASTKKESEQER